MNIEDFSKVELRVAKVSSAERVEGSDKLLKLSVMVGDKNEAGEDVPRQILAGIGKRYQPEEMVGKQIIIVANLDPRELMGQVSQGMLLAATNAEGMPILATVESEVPPGTRLK